MAENITNIPAPRVAFIDPRTGLMAREWYRFLVNIFMLTGGGQSDISISDLAVAPVGVDDSQNIEQPAQLSSIVAQYDQAASLIQGAYVSPPTVLDELSIDPLSYCAPAQLQGAVTAVTATAPITSSGGATPNIAIADPASININGTVGATTPNTGAFTTLTASTSLTIAGTTALTGYKTGTWTPTFNGFATVGADSSTATYVRIGKMMFVTIQVVFATSSASTAGTSNISGMPNANTRAGALVSAASNGTAVSYGSGYANAGGGLYTPTWGATASVVVSAFYETDDAF